MTDLRGASHACRAGGPQRGPAQRSRTTRRLGHDGLHRPQAESPAALSAGSSADLGWRGCAPYHDNRSRSIRDNTRAVHATDATHATAYGTTDQADPRSERRSCDRRSRPNTIITVPTITAKDASSPTPSHLNAPRSGPTVSSRMYAAVRSRASSRSRRDGIGTPTFNQQCQHAPTRLH